MRSKTVNDTVSYRLTLCLFYFLFEAALQTCQNVTSYESWPSVAVDVAGGLIFEGVQDFKKFGKHYSILSLYLCRFF